MNEYIQEKINKIKNETQFEGISPEDVAAPMTLLNKDKASKKDLANISSGFQFSINPETPEPEGGWQKGIYPAEVSGIYPNQNNEEIDLSFGLSLLVYDGENWSKIVAGVDVVPIVERYVSLTDSTTNPPSAFVFSDSYINQVNGKVEGAPGYKASDFIPIPFWVAHINMGYGNYNQFALYDIDKQFLPTSFSEDGILDFDRPEDAFFIRHTSNNGEVEKHLITFSNIKLSRKKALEGIEFSNQIITASDTVLKSGFYISQDSGFEGLNAGFSVSDFIDIYGAEYILTGNFYNQFAFYDVNRVFIPISEDSTVKGIFKVPNNTKFIRVTIANFQIEDFFFQFFTKKDFQNFAFQSLITKSNYKASDLRLIDGGYINQDHGRVENVAYYSYSDFILIPASFSKVNFDEASYQQYAFYDINKTYISGGLQTKKNIPENAIYLRVTVRNSDAPHFFVKFINSEHKQLTVINVTPADGSNAIQNAIDSITDASASNRYQINVAAGPYKVSNSSQFNNPDYPAFIIPKDHVDIIGASKEDVIVWAELPYNDEDIDTTTARNMHQTVYNWADDVLIKNITFVAKNIRYVVHQDTVLESNKKRYYENCDFIFKGDKGSVTALGIGTWSGSETYIKDGKSVNSISNPIAIHNWTKQDKESVWSFENHEFINLTTNHFLNLQNSGSIVGDKLFLKNCSFGGGYRMTYVDWWVYDPSLNKSFNHAEWRVLGSGNEPFYFENSVDGQALCITANTIGQKVRFDKNSSAYNVLIKNEQNYFGHIGHPEREIIDRDYIIHDYDNGFKSYAIGGRSIRETPYLWGEAISGESLAQRLGNRTGTPITLTVFIGDKTKNIVFNQNYSSMNNAAIIALINAQLGADAVASSYNIGLDYYPELSDVNFISGTYNSNFIEKGTIVTRHLGLVLKAQTGDEIFGVAFDNIAGRTIVNGEVKGIGRILKNCILHKDQIKVASGVVIVKGGRYSVNNGELVVNATGQILAVEDNLLKI